MRLARPNAAASWRPPVASTSAIVALAAVRLLLLGHPPHVTTALHHATLRLATPVRRRRPSRAVVPPLVALVASAALAPHRSIGGRWTTRREVLSTLLELRVLESDSITEKRRMKKGRLVCVVDRARVRGHTSKARAVRSMRRQS